MLKQFTVRGFKSLRDVTVDLGRVNVFVGPNGCGKSNLLEALGFFSAAVDGEIDDLALSRRGIRLGPESIYATSLQALQPFTSISYESHLLESGSEHVYSVTVSRSTGDKARWLYEAEQLRVDGDEILDRTTSKASVFRFIKSEGIPAGGFVSDSGSLIRQLSRVSDRELQSPDNALKDIILSIGTYVNPFVKFLSDYAIFSPTTPILRGLQPDPSQRAPVGLFGGRLAEALSSLLDTQKDSLGSLALSEVLNMLEWPSEIAITPPGELMSPNVPSTRYIVRFKDRFMNPARNELSGYDASEGALYVLFMLVLALSPETPKIYAVDNFDIALNPLLAKKLTKTFVDLVLADGNTTQVLLSTHQPAVLDGLDILDDDVRLFTMDRDETGASQVQRITVTDDIVMGIRDGYSLSRLWTSGRLGGVPNL